MSKSRRRRGRGQRAVNSNTSLILEFSATTLMPIRYRKQNNGDFHIGGRFRVFVLFNHLLDNRHLEYRQYIRGSFSVQRGSFSSENQTTANWVANGPEHSLNNIFSVPGGLRRSFSEDGEVRRGRGNSRWTENYGYRSRRPVHRSGIEDRYLPNQRTGHIYRCMDTFGASGRRTGLTLGNRFRMNIVYQGRVINTRNRQIVDSRQWRYRIDYIIRTPDMR